MSLSLVRASRLAMGTEFEIFLVGADPDYLRDAATQALDEVERLDAQLSHYRADSDVCDLNRRAPLGPVRLEPGLYSLLRRAAALSEGTGGAFDCTAGPLVRCWGFFRGHGRLPLQSEIREARESVGSRYLHFVPGERAVLFLHPRLEVHLGAIGKGYAIDRAVEILRGLGVSAALMHGGTSTVYALGAPPGADAWEVGLCDPRNRARRLGVVRLCDRALSTSGDFEQFFELDGRRYSHILDPRTGEPARGIWSATVLAESAADTDALSTAAFVLGEADLSGECPSFAGAGIVLVPEPQENPGRSELNQRLVVLGDVEVLPGDELGSE